MKTIKKAIIIEGFGGLVFFFMFLGVFYDVPVLYILLGMPLSWLAFMFVGEKFGLYKKEPNKVPVSDRTENFLFISAMITAGLGAVLVTDFFPPDKKTKLEEFAPPTVPLVLERERPQAPEVVQEEPAVRPPFREIVPEVEVTQEVPCCGGDLPEEESPQQATEEGVPRREDGWHPLMEEVPPEDIVEYAEHLFQDSENNPAEESEGDWVEESGLDWNKARLELLDQFEGWQKASLAAAMLEAEQFMEVMSEEDARWIQEKVQRQFDAVVEHPNPSSEHDALFYKSLEMTAAVARSQASAVAKEIRAEIARRTRELHQELGDPGPPPRLQFEEEGR